MVDAWHFVFYSSLGFLSQRTATWLAGWDYIVVFLFGLFVFYIVLSSIIDNSTLAKKNRL
jgi:hypothetical protein